MILVVGDCGGCQLVGFYFILFYGGGGGWQWLVVGVAVIGVAWTKKKVVERERDNGKIKIILFK